MSGPETQGKPNGGVKGELRRVMRDRLRVLTVEERARGSEAVCARLGASPWFVSRRCILAYAAMASEPDLTAALREAEERGATLVFPRFDAETGEYVAVEVRSGDRWEAGPYGVQEPGMARGTVPFERLDLVLVPGLAFDRTGRRLGRGRGFFDRMLARASRAPRCGVCWDLQLVDAVPVEAHDVNMDMLVTPGLWLPVTPGF